MVAPRQALCMILSSVLIPTTWVLQLCVFIVEECDIFCVVAVTGMLENPERSERNGTEPEVMMHNADVDAGDVARN